MGERHDGARRGDGRGTGALEHATDILIPAMRVERFAGLVENVESTTPEPHTVWWMVGTDEAEAELRRLGQQCFRDEGGTWGNRLNFMFARTHAPYVFLGADDVRFHDGWLRAALGAQRGLEGVVAVADLFNPEGTLALVARSYIERFSGCVDQPGVVIHPGYRHNYSETELFGTARARRRFRYCPDAVVEHLHWANGKSPRDPVYDVCEETMADDRARYMARRGLWGEHDPSAARQFASRVASTLKRRAGSAIAAVGRSR